MTTKPNTNSSPELKTDSTDTSQFSSPPTKKSRKVTIWKAKWSKKEYAVYFDDHSTTINDIKVQLQDETLVHTNKQKLIGFKFQKEFDPQKSRKISDSTLVFHLKCKSKKGFIMIGTLEENTFHDNDIYGADVPYVIDDFDWEYSLNDSEIAKRAKANNVKLRNIISLTTINTIVEPRKGKKLLVLDIDYTVFDMSGMRNKKRTGTVDKYTQNWSSLKRPFSDYMLEKCHKYYDIAFWSQTSWQWIEIKLTEMNMLMNAKYNITFILDKKAMITIVSDFKQGNRKHWIKPLQLIWDKFDGIYNENNTVHIDDLSRNFAMNPKQGLCIKPYKNAGLNYATDKELLYLTEYLLLIAEMDSFRGLQHSKWKQFLKQKQDQQFM